MENKSINFYISRDYEKSLPKLIETNFEEMKQFLKEQTKKDYAVVVDKDNYIASKERCALLNKQYDLIDIERKNVKKEYFKAYNDFDNKCKELLNIISGAKDSIWSQITSIESNYDESQKIALENEFNDLMGDYKGLRSFDKIWDKKWLTKAKENTCHKELADKVATIKKEIDIIIGTSGEYKASMLANYSQGMDFSDVITLLDKCKEINRDYLKENEESENDPPFSKNETSDTFTLNFSITGTASQIRGLREYLQINNIKYNKI